MTREQQLKFCKKCLNRELDLKVGLICNLTGQKADFENECESFELDESVIEKSDDNEKVDHQEVINNLSPTNLERFKSEQNFTKALITGIVTGLIGALLWGAITVITEFQIGYMAIAIGAGVGFSMGYIGKGLDQIFGITGGIIALLSCLLGNFFSIIGFIANSQDLGFFEALLIFDYGQLIPIMSETFSPIDLLFYGIAAFAGYKYAFRKFTQEELMELEK